MRISALGSMPGTDFREATRMVADLLPDLLAWPELPARDASSAMIGRTLGLLEQPANLTADGWRLAASSDTAQQRAARWWRNDLDDFEELTQHHEGALKVAVTGPWTLASAVRLAHPTMNHVISDPGACRDLGQALAEGIAELVGRLGRLGRELVVQLDEPAIGAVLGGELATFSGLQRYRTPEADEVLASWRWSVEAIKGAGAVPWLQSCAPGLDLGQVGRAGFDGVALDARFIDDRALDAIGGWLDAGATLGLGIARTDQVRVPAVDELVAEALRTLRPLEMDPELLDANVVLTPACGLAGWPAGAAAQLLERLAPAAELVAEQLRR